MSAGPDKPTPWPQRVGAYVGTGGGAIAASAGLIGLLNSTNLWHANRPPEIVSFAADVHKLAAREARIITSEARDADGDRLEYRYDASEGTMTGHGSSAEWMPPTLLRDRVVRFHVSVSDGHATVTAERSIAVNRAPAGAIEAPADVRRNAVVNLNAAVTDADGDQLTYSWSASAGAFTTNDSAVVFWRAPATAGDVAIVCVVKDGLETSRLTVRIRVS